MYTSLLLALLAKAKENLLISSGPENIGVHSHINKYMDPIFMV